MDEEERLNNERYQHILKMKDLSCDCYFCRDCIEKNDLHTYFDMMNKNVSRTCTECKKYLSFDKFKRYDCHVCDFCVKNLYLQDFKTYKQDLLKKVIIYFGESESEDAKYEKKLLCDEINKSKNNWELWEIEKNFIEEKAEKPDFTIIFDDTCSIEMYEPDEDEIIDGENFDDKYIVHK